LIIDILRSIVSLGITGVIGDFSEVASLVKAPLGKVQIQEVILAVLDVGKDFTEEDNSAGEY
jgi:hypothetical protein